MENEKKKRHKKKKNKQGKTSTSAGVGELTSENNNHANVTNQNLNSDSSDVPKKGAQQTIVDSDRESISGAETSCSVVVEKSYWLNREISLKQKIKELQEQLDMHVQREVDLEKRNFQSQKERNLWLHKETELEAIISELQTEKQSWVQKEKSATETTASLNKDNAKLRAQVIELETSINNISHQNQQLKELASEPHSKIQDLESSVATCLSSEKTKHAIDYEDMNSRLESAQALVAKLISEKEKLVEKVNVLETKLDQKTATTESSSPIKPSDPMVQNQKPADMDETSTTETDSTPSSSEEIDTVSNVGLLLGSKEGMPTDKFVNRMNSEGSDLNQIARMESGEIVQISLNENVVTAGDPVPLTDAPLIGAPFRLISFVARYVSGADLVQK